MVKSSTEIAERLRVLEIVLGKPANSLGKLAGLGNATVTGWNDNQLDNPTAVCEKFLDHYNINRSWWRTGKGDVLNEPDQNKQLLISTQRELLKFYRSEIDRLNEEIARLKSNDNT